MKCLSFALLAALVMNASAGNPSASPSSAKNPFNGRPSYSLSSSRSVDCKLKDAGVLRKLYESTNGDQWKGRFKTKWNSEEPCSFCELGPVVCNPKKKE